jgi:hypothetical protein
MLAIEGKPAIKVTSSKSKETNNKRTPAKEGAQIGKIPVTAETPGNSP